MPMTLRQLEAFRALMAAGSVTKAAQAMGVSQPTVSRLIADLEAVAGLALFERARSGLHPTPEALAFDTEVERAFSGLSHLETVARGLRGSARLSVVATPSILPQLTESLIGPFMREHPEIVLSLDVQTTRRSLEWVLTRQVELGLTFEPVNNAELAVSVVGRSEAVCLIPKEHRLARSTRPIQLDAMVGEDFVAFKPDSVFQQQLDSRFAAAGGAPRVRAEVRTTEAACLLAASLPALTVIPSGAAPRGGDRLVARRVVPAIPSEIVVVRHATRPLSAAARDFVAFAERRAAANGRARP